MNPSASACTTRLEEEQDQEQQNQMSVKCVPLLSRKRLNSVPHPDYHILFVEIIFDTFSFWICSLSICIALCLRHVMFNLKSRNH